MLETDKNVDILVENPTKLLSIKDDSFDINKISDYHLTFYIQKLSIQVIVVDHFMKRVMMLEDYKLTRYNHIGAINSITHVLDLLFDLNPYINASYWKEINLVFQNAYFALVPKSLFDEKYLKEYLYINTSKGDDDNYHIAYSQNDQNISNRKDIVTVFAIEKNIENKIKEKYATKKITISHHTTHLFNIPQYLSTPLSDVDICIFDSQDSYTLCIWKNNMLQLCNTYHYKTKEDFIYYILFACDQLEILPKAAQCHYYSNVGYTSTDATYSKSLKVLHEYFTKINLNTRPKGYYMSYLFDEIKDYQFNELFTIA